MSVIQSPTLILKLQVMQKPLLESSCVDKTAVLTIKNMYLIWIYFSLTSNWKTLLYLLKLGEGPFHLKYFQLQVQYRNIDTRSDKQNRLTSLVCPLMQFSRLGIITIASFWILWKQLSSGISGYFIRSAITHTLMVCLPKIALTRTLKNITVAKFIVLFLIYVYEL